MLGPPFHFERRLGLPPALIRPQVAGVDVRFEEKMRGVVEYMQFRELTADLKRKVSKLSLAVSVRR